MSNYWEKRYLEQGSSTVGHGGMSDAEFKKQTSMYCSLILKHLHYKVRPGNVVLDFGCGYGRFYEFMRSQHKEYSYYGVDIVKWAVDEANSRFSQDKNFLGCATINYSDDLLPQLSKDIVEHVKSVVCCTVLQHIVDEEELHKALALISQIYKTGTPGDGIVLLENTSDNEDKSHIKFRSEETYIDLFKQYGININPIERITCKREEHTLFTT